MQINTNFAEVAIIDKEQLQTILNEIATLKEKLAILENSTIPAKVYYDYHDVSQMTGYKVGYLKQLVHYKKIPSLRVGRSVRFERKAIEDWIASQPDNIIETKVANHLINHTK